jgi:hypothetical protein
MEENDLAEQGFQIEELAWLKRKDKVLGKFASLGIWFDSTEGAEYILNNGLLVGQRYIGSVERREIKKKRCFRCQRFGHLTWSCKETPRCGHCAGQHERQRCPPGIRARFLDCRGEHPTGDRQCATPATSNPPSMLETNLRILWLNIMKSGPRMEALINDHQGQDLDILLIQEPSITTYRTRVNHSAWRLYQPTVETDATRFRSLVYVNRRMPTASHRQVPCDHPDVAAVKIWTPDSQILLFSVYLPSVPLYSGDNTSAEPTLTAIQNTITSTLQVNRRTTSIILSGDWRSQPPSPPVGRQSYINQAHRRRQRPYRLLPKQQSPWLPSSWNRNLLGPERPRTELHHRPDSD